MIPKANFHTHTTYCDGRESAEEMVLAAIQKGFTALGFSGHCYTDYDESYCMKKEEIPLYLKEIEELQKKYGNQIAIYKGVEQDFYSKESVEPFDYAIGSVHYVKSGDAFLCVDESEERCKKDIQEFYGGDAYAYAEEYCRTVGQVLDKTKADIIGHFDMVSKFNEQSQLVDTSHTRYQKEAMEAVDALIGKGKPFEINTGAIYRGLRSEPYPSLNIWKEIQARGGDILFSSDSHDGNSMGFYFEELGKLALEIGFTRALIWTPQGFEEIGL